MENIKRVIDLLIGWFRKLSSHPITGLDPRKILSLLLSELEKKKKLGIEDKAFVPNFYVIYLNPFDFDELSPLLSGITDQLKNKLMDKIKTKGYRLLSSAVNLDIRQDRSLERDQMVVETSFIKEKNAPSLNLDDSSLGSSPSLSAAHLKSGSHTDAKTNSRLPEKNVTRIADEKRTKYIDLTKVCLEILEGGNKGETIALKEGEYTFGRGRESKILLKDPEETVSRRHFQLNINDNKLTIKDLQSTNGTRVNEIDIEEAELKKGDTIRAGKVALRVA